MQQLHKIVNYYLNSDTNNALMITGEWGAGKTHYFKNVLKNQISNTKLFDDQTKNYRPLLISLFGLTTIEEIQTEIILSLNPILKNKGVKIGASIAKSLIKGLMNLKGLGEYYDVASEVEVDKVNWIKVKELVICFDDLERLSNNLSMKDFIGYVNSLVENENVKVLIIANEGKIPAENFSELKEKVIGNSIEFIPDINYLFDSLVQDKFSSSPTYSQFLIKNKEIIKETYTKNSSNLRILSFALSYFQNVYSEINIGLIDQKLLLAKKEEILIRILKFSLAISIEYKEGRVSFRAKNDLDKPIIRILENDNYKENEQKTYQRIFISKYFLNDSFTFFESIFNFITGGSIFYLSELIIELNKLYNIVDDNIPDHYQVYNSLSYPQVFSLTDREYIEQTKKLLEYSDSGAYELLHCLDVFHFLTRFSNPLKFSLEKLEKRIINGLKKGTINYAPHRSLDYYLTIDESIDHKDRALRIRETALKINNDIAVSKKKFDAVHLESKCYENFTAFYHEVLYQNKQLCFEPIFKDFNPAKFLNFFVVSDGETKWLITRFWNSRYNDIPYSDLKEEVYFLETLKNKLEKKMRNLSKSGLSNFIYTEHIKILQKSIGKLK